MLKHFTEKKLRGHKRLSSVEQFKNPPVQEALLDIQVTLPAETTLNVLRKFQAGLEARFPERQERISLQQGFQISGAGDSQAITSSRSVDGYWFVAKADGKIVQARRDGFTFNKLRPYSNWDTFSAEAKELWQRYVEIAKPANVRRIGLRYLNRIEIPLPFRDFREFCLLFPDLPPKIPQALTEFFLRFAVPVESVPAAAASVTLTFEPPQQAATLPLILDIDAFQSFEMLSPDTEEIWKRLAVLRGLKNDIFDASLTDKTKAMFR